MVFGTFDIIHGGHLHMFKQAKEYGDKLVVVVARDVNVEKIKNNGALHSENERLELLKHINLIDEVVLGDLDDPYKRVLEICPDIVALGYDQKEYVDNLQEALMKCANPCRIVRLTAHKENELKSNKIRKYIERLV